MENITDKSYLWGAIRYQRVGLISILYVFGFHAFERVCSIIRIAGIKFIARWPTLRRGG